MTTNQYEIEEAIADKYGSYPDEFWETLSNRTWQGIDKPVNLPGVGDVFLVEAGNNSNVDSYGYDQGGEAWIIFKVGDQTFRKNGYTSSYGGAEYDGALFPVKRHEETIVVKSWVRA